MCLIYIILVVTSNKQKLYYFNFIDVVNDVGNYCNNQYQSY